MIKKSNKKTRLSVLAFCVFVLLYSTIVIYVFQLENIYSNPFFRLLEFVIGIVLAALKLDYAENQFVKRFLYNWGTVIITNIVMIVGVSIAVKLKIAVGNYMLYSWICLPCFMIMLFGLSGVESEFLSKSKTIKWLSGISYVLFLAQLYSNVMISKRIIAVENIDNNLIKILIGWGVCFAIAIILRFIEIRINRLTARL